MTESADALKAKVLDHWRYRKQCPMVALEASSKLYAWNDGGQADVLAVTKAGLLIETEVKRTLADLRADLKKPKHWHYYRQYFGKDLSESAHERFRSWKREEALVRFSIREPRGYPTRYFYFAVPEQMINPATLILDELYPYAGLLNVRAERSYAGLFVAIVRDAKRLSGERLSMVYLTRMAREMSATIARLACIQAGVE